MARRPTIVPRAAAPTTVERFAVLSGRAEALATLAEHNLQVNACMAEVMRSAIAGEWSAAYLRCAELVRAVGLACVTCGEQDRRAGR